MKQSIYLKKGKFLVEQEPPPQIVPNIKQKTQATNQLSTNQPQTQYVQPYPPPPEVPAQTDIYSPQAEYIPYDPNAQPPEEILDPLAASNHSMVRRKIGTVQELKNIYSRLLTLDDLVDNYSHETFLEIKKTLTDALDLFHVIVINYENLTDVVDNIILDYYDFLLKISESTMDAVDQIHRELNKKK
jgi:hypothetical protein